MNDRRQGMNAEVKQRQHGFLFEDHHEKTNHHARDSSTNNDLMSFDTEDFFPQFKHTEKLLIKERPVNHDEDCGVRIHQNESIDTIDLMMERCQREESKKWGTGGSGPTNRLEIMESLELPLPTQQS